MNLHHLWEIKFTKVCVSASIGDLIQVQNMEAHTVFRTETIIVFVQSFD